MISVGLHLRIQSTILELLQRAHLLEVATFQCFLFNQVDNKYIDISDDERDEFLRLRHQFFDELYIHGSYWINLASQKSEQNHYILKKEIAKARQLEFDYLVLHPGTVTGWETKEAGIDCIARVLNNLLKKERDITIVLENTAFDGMSIGSDLYELRMIREKLEHPEKIKFCLDTAHAYAWGYDLCDMQARVRLAYDLKETVGDALALIHLNDTQEPCGSKKDKHALLGQGNIELSALKSFIFENNFQEIPIIAELPLVAESEQEGIVKKLKEWGV